VEKHNNPVKKKQILYKIINCLNFFGKFKLHLKERDESTRSKNGCSLGLLPWHGLNKMLSFVLITVTSQKSSRIFRTHLIPAAHLISSSDNNMRAAQWADHQWNVELTDNRIRLRIFIPDTGTPLGMTLQSRAWVRVNRLRTSVGRFRSCLYKWGMASSVACECGAEEQTVDHGVLQCLLIYRPPHGPHGLTVLDDETTNGCSTPAPRSSAAKQWFEKLAQKKFTLWGMTDIRDSV